MAVVGAAEDQIKACAAREQIRDRQGQAAVGRVDFAVGGAVKMELGVDRVTFLPGVVHIGWQIADCAGSFIYLTRAQAALIIGQRRRGLDLDKVFCLRQQERLRTILPQRAHRPGAGFQRAQQTPAALHDLAQIIHRDAQFITDNFDPAGIGPIGAEQCDAARFGHGEGSTGRLAECQVETVKKQ